MKKNHIHCDVAFFRLPGDLIGHLATPSWIRVPLLQVGGHLVQ